MPAPSPFVIDDLDDFSPASIFVEGRDQVVIGIKVTPVYGQLELALLASVVDAANEHGFSLARYEPFRDDYLLCLFETYDDDEAE